jgi:hypothetical protein
VECGGNIFASHRSRQRTLSGLPGLPLEAVYLKNTRSDNGDDDQQQPAQTSHGNTSLPLSKAPSG